MFSLIFFLFSASITGVNKFFLLFLWLLPIPAHQSSYSFFLPFPLDVFHFYWILMAVYYRLHWLFLHFISLIIYNFDCSLFCVIHSLNFCVFVPALNLSFRPCQKRRKTLEGSLVVWIGVFLNCWFCLPPKNYGRVCYYYLHICVLMREEFISYEY